MHSVNLRDFVKSNHFFRQKYSLIKKKGKFQLVLSFIYSKKKYIVYRKKKNTSDRHSFKRSNYIVLYEGK